MKVKCDLEIDFNNEEDVKTVIKSIKVDDFDFVKSKMQGTTLKASIQSDSVSSLLHTLDDYLACVSVASKILDKD